MPEVPLALIDILVPVLGRPASAQPLVDSARVTQGGNVVFVCSPNDPKQIAACMETGARVLVTDWHPGKADFAKKINWAFDQTDSEWVFQGADDIRFSEGWDTVALGLARGHNKRVAGTNDLHNPSVRRGHGSTHTLFARSYIEEYGSGTLDDSGRVFCEHYDHQYVDSEFVEVAKRRREWIFCRRSIVEHFHPHWGNAESDSTYTKAMRCSGADMHLYLERMGWRRRSVPQRSRR